MASSLAEQGPGPNSNHVAVGPSPPNNELATLLLLVRASPKKSVQNHRLLGLCARSSYTWSATIAFLRPNTKCVAIHADG